MTPFHLPVPFLTAVAVAALFFGAVVSSGIAQGTSPHPTAGVGKSRFGTGQLSNEPADVAFRRKIDTIVIPSIEFRATTLGDAVEFLRQESRRLDLDPDMAARGVNIVLKLPVTGQTAIVARDAAAASQVNRQTTTAGSLIDPPVPSVSPRITLTMNRIPLLEALRYIAVQAGLKVRVDPYAISLIPLTEDSDKLVTATFHVAPGFINNTNNTISGGGRTALDQAAAAAR